MSYVGSSRIEETEEIYLSQEDTTAKELEEYLEKSSLDDDLQNTAFIDLIPDDDTSDTNIHSNSILDLEKQSNANDDQMSFQGNATLSLIEDFIYNDFTIEVPDYEKFSEDLSLVMKTQKEMALKSARLGDTEKKNESSSADSTLPLEYEHTFAGSHIRVVRVHKDETFYEKLNFTQNP